MDRKDKIVESTFLLFLDKGIEGTSLKDIIKKANISNGGFYYYFKSKEDLIIEVIETYVYFYFSIPFDEIDDNEKSTLNKIKFYIAKSIGYDQDKKVFTNVTYSCEEIDYKKLCGLYFSSFRKYDLLRNKHQQHNKYIKNIIKKLINNGIKSGEIKNNINSDHLSSIIMSIFVGDLVTWVASDNIDFFDFFVKNLDYAWDNFMR